MSTRAPSGNFPSGPTKSVGWAIIWLLALLAGACAGEGASAPLPPPPEVVNVGLREDGLRYDHSIGPGRTVFRVHNTGRRRHDLALIPLPQDLPPIDVLLRSKTRQVLANLAYVPPVGPADRVVFAVDLAPGRYAMLAFVTGPNGTPDTRKSTTSEFRVR